MRIGLTSVTFRKLSAEEIIALAMQAGVDAIEWGADVHVPPRAPANARAVKQQCVSVGIDTPSYGTYIRCLSPSPSEDDNDASLAEDFKYHLEVAEILDCDTLRVWAGTLPSADADSAYRERIAENVSLFARLAHGKTIAFEYHNSTLADNSESILELIKRIDMPNVRCYWQPLDMMTEEQIFESIAPIRDYITNVHVFYDQSASMPLMYAFDKWTRYFAEIRKGDDSAITAYIEFVKNAAPSQFLEDAAVLYHFLSNV